MIALTMGGTVAYYTYTTYLTKFLSTAPGMEKSTASLVSFCALFVFMCIQPLAGMALRPGRPPPAADHLRRRLHLPDRADHDDAQARRDLLARVRPGAARLVVVTGYTSINAW